jgi:heme/copper-type cytochrome/quinol oxidase subunit 2
MTPDTKLARMKLLDISGHESTTKFDPAEAEARRRARRLALLLMAASALVTLLVIAALWWMARRLL